MKIPRCAQGLALGACIGGLSWLALVTSFRRSMPSASISDWTLRADAGMLALFAGICLGIAAWSALARNKPRGTRD